MFTRGESCPGLPQLFPEAVMTCIKPSAPAQLLALGSKRDSWNICAASNLQSNSYCAPYFFTISS